jgi:hypothetical protein
MLASVDGVALVPETMLARAAKRYAAATKGRSMQHTHEIGDFVVPMDLPRRFVCRVVATHAVDDTGLQMLELEPLDGPWPPDTRLIRGSESVRDAVQGELQASSEPPPTIPFERTTTRRRRRAHPRRSTREIRERTAPGAA